MPKLRPVHICIDARNPCNRKALNRGACRLCPVVLRCRGGCGPCWNRRMGWDDAGWVLLLLALSTALVLAVAAPALAQFTAEVGPGNWSCSAVPYEPGLGFFLNLGYGAERFLLGVVFGIIFGFIDNAGLWVGMDWLDPLFDPSQTPWVYGRGGKRAYSGFYYGGADSVYESTTLFAGVAIGQAQLSLLAAAQKTQLAAIRQDPGAARPARVAAAAGPPPKVAAKQFNQECFADPLSPMFLGHFVPAGRFTALFGRGGVNEEAYDAALKELQLRDSHGTSTYFIPREEGAGGPEAEPLVEKQRPVGSGGAPVLRFERRRHWWECVAVGGDRVVPTQAWKVAEAWASGWRPGQLTQAGIGNTFSDTLGAFVGVFVGGMVVVTSRQCQNSLLSEALGIAVGCVLGVAFFRVFLGLLTVKT